MNTEEGGQAYAISAGISEGISAGSQAYAAEAREPRPTAGGPTLSDLNAPLVPSDHGASDSDTARQLQGKAQQESGIGALAAGIQMVQGNLGPGILTLPFIFSVGGMLPTSGMMVVVTLTTLYSMQLVLLCERWLREQDKIKTLGGGAHAEEGSYSYEEIGGRLLGERGRRLIVMFVVLMQLGICVVFLNYSAENLLSAQDFYFTGEIHINLTHNDSQPEPGFSKGQLVFMVAPVPLLLSMWSSAVVVTVAVTCASILIWTGLITILFLAVQQIASPVLRPQSPVLPEDPGALPIVLGNCLYTVTTGVGILMPIFSSMRGSQRQRYSGVVNKAILLDLSLFLAVGILVNVAFGEQGLASVTAEFSSRSIGPPTFMAIINLLLGMSVLLTYPLQFGPAARVLEDALGAYAYGAWGRMLLRASLVLCTAVLAAVVPQLHLVVSLAGSFTSAVLALMIPPAMDMVVQSRDPTRRSLLRLCMDFFAIFMGCCGLVGGTGATLLKILGVDFPPGTAPDVDPDPSPVTPE